MKTLYFKQKSHTYVFMSCLVISSIYYLKITLTYLIFFGVIYTIVNMINIQ